jgi:hypothetical protein
MQVIDYTAVNDTFKAWVLGSSPSALTICFNDLRRNQQRASNAINHNMLGRIIPAFSLCRRLDSTPPTSPVTNRAKPSAQLRQA